MPTSLIRRRRRRVWRYVGRKDWPVGGGGMRGQCWRDGPIYRPIQSQDDRASIHMYVYTHTNIFIYIRIYTWANLSQKFRK